MPTSHKCYNGQQIRTGNVRISKLLLLQETMAVSNSKNTFIKESLGVINVPNLSVKTYSTRKITYVQHIKQYKKDQCAKSDIHLQ